jgi:tRNA A-37 threonylcarbamoyl transferase component Bud32
MIEDNPNAGDNMIEFESNREELIQYLHEKDVNQESIDHNSSNMNALHEERKFGKKKIQKQKLNKVNNYQVKEHKRAKSNATSPEIGLNKKFNKEENEPSSQEKIVTAIEESFKTNGTPPKTNVDFYRAGKVLGKGAFGKVSLALHKLSKKLVALKLLNKEFLKNETSKAKVMQEVDILIRFRHPNVVKLFETFESNKHIIVVMELCAGGDLLNYVRKRRRLKETYAKYIFKQIIEGIAHVHAKGVLHRDIKLDNILLDGKGTIKIGDFGVSRIIKNINEKMTEQ